MENFTGHKVKTLNRQWRRVHLQQLSSSPQGLWHLSRADYTQDPRAKWSCQAAQLHLMETARAMLLDAKLPHRFWAEAICHVPEHHLLGYQALATFLRLTTNKLLSSKQINIHDCDIHYIELMQVAQGHDQSIIQNRQSLRLSIMWQ